MTSKPDISPPSTRDRILEVAERLFAERGYNKVSLRSITAAAEANMAAVHYYFRTKEALLRAIFEARVAPISEERKRLLREVLERSGDARPPIRDVLAAFIGPGVRLARTPEGAVFNQLSAICSVDPDPTVRAIVFSVHDEVAREFVRALQRACPELDPKVFFVRLQCVFGSMMYIRANNGRVNRLLRQDAPLPHDVDALLDMMLDFLAAGLAAPGSTRSAGTAAYTHPLTAAEQGTTDCTASLPDAEAARPRRRKARPRDA